MIDCAGFSAYSFFQGSIPIGRRVQALWPTQGTCLSELEAVISEFIVMVIICIGTGVCNGHDSLHYANVGEKSRFIERWLWFIYTRLQEVGACYCAISYNGEAARKGWEV